MTIQKYDWVSKDTKLNANGWSVPLNIIQNSEVGGRTYWKYFFLNLPIAYNRSINKKLKLD